MSIDVQNISKNFRSVAAVQEVSLAIPDGELVALLGPSGSGKTTLLRMIAGLEFPDAGKIHFNGEDVNGRPVGQRGVGFVFQHYALFRHMTVFQNIAFGLKVRPWRSRPSRGAIRERVMELLELIQLKGIEDRYPSQLSGGQRQRVALARALAIEPKVLLLDEPFGALDARVRQSLRQWLRNLHDQIHVTSVFVTHDQEEALELADTVVVMNHGRIEQIGPPEEVFHRPANPFVMEFLGTVNLFHARSESSGSRTSRVRVRPHDLEILTKPNGQSQPASIVRILAAGSVVKVELARGTGETVHAELSHEAYRDARFHVGQPVHIRPRRAYAFEEDYSI
ncbi:MAG TPA: sulfate ABC transporter ATP-binding protein [Tepidisphaeraceae bacterium]|jgi:sulfate transport system ATP-binding protein|nr:sulfate ABC transporter ATP-binding protein [Tepidisphaeraceae bacterium]